MTISVNWTMIRIAQSLGTELQVYLEIQRKHENQNQIDCREKYHCH